jgi:hypothetical protein
MRHFHTKNRPKKLVSKWSWDGGARIMSDIIKNDPVIYVESVRRN